MLNIINISKDVLTRLYHIAEEKTNSKSIGQLIFASHNDAARISEQELRHVFIEMISGDAKKYYYSIETPTFNAYNFSNKEKEIHLGDDIFKGRCALIDLCLFEKESDESHYKRILNIEFKYDNVSFNNFSKDILKLMHEPENGAFILLLNNTDSGSLINSSGRKGAIDKIIESFYVHNLKNSWNGGDDKFVEIVIMSLEGGNNIKVPQLWHRRIDANDLVIKPDLADWTNWSLSNCLSIN